MLRRIKRFIRSRLDNEKHPAIHAWYTARGERKRQRMSYAEIEAEISRIHESVFGRKLDWDNPQTYNDKINVSMVYMATPLKTRLADKYLVREWIREKIGEEYLIPLLGVYDSFDEIDFDALPDKFVIKCNHDCASVTLVNDKSKINMSEMKRRYDEFMSKNYAWVAWEMHYKDIRPKIIIQQHMGESINDYKFMCFDGKIFCCWVDVDRFIKHRRNFYDLQWNLLPFTKGYDNSGYIVPVPECFDEMKEVVSKLCAGFDHVRVDLYVVEGHIYFGEMTFTTEGGYAKFNPDEWDYKIGELWPFDNTVRRKILSEHSRPEN